MNSKKIFFAGFLLAFLSLSSQEQSIDTVYVFDRHLKNAKSFQKITVLENADLEKNATNLSEVLRFQSPVYIKENGRGAVASPSFRGTTAAQTAFVWNGININSNFLGQGDLNNIGFLNSDELEIKSGGGSVIYGSGAIGGSIHLNNTLAFNKGFQGSLFSEAASFGTYNSLLRTAFSNEKLSVKFSGSYLISENNYEVKEQDYLNRNGQYYNTTFSFGASYKIATRQKISWISEFFNGMQHYPVFTENGNRTRYGTQNLRSLLVWDADGNSLSNSLKAAYTEENFQYFTNLEGSKTTGGTGRNYIIKDDFSYFFNSTFHLNIIGEFQRNEGEGFETGIGKISRNTGSVSALLRYFASKKLKFEGGIKKDFVENISSPVLFSFNSKWDVLSWYNLGVSFSRNFRFPSFNDLYWQPGGNLDLKSETSYQAEIRNEFKFKSFHFSVTPYYMKISDMIRWLPTTYGYWAAFNTNKVESYGIESSIAYEYKTEKQFLKTNVGYNFSKSANMETHKQLMYAPFHKIFGNIQYGYSFASVFVQGMYNGQTYTDSEENPKYALDPYFVVNAGLSFTLKKQYTIGVKVQNIFDEMYETVKYYPMPKRNYSISAKINF